MNKLPLTTLTSRFDDLKSTQQSTQTAISGLRDEALALEPGKQVVDGWLKKYDCR